MWQSEELLRCSGCGLNVEETFAVENHGTYKAHRLQCHACAARDEKAADAKGPMHGTYWRVAQD